MDLSLEHIIVVILLCFNGSDEGFPFHVFFFLAQAAKKPRIESSSTSPGFNRQ